MNYTAQQLENHLFSLVRNSEDLTFPINGGVYHGGLRPRDSRLEDITVSYVSGMAGEVQSAVFYVNIFVNDIDPWGNGVYVQNMVRTADFERRAQAFAETLVGDGQFKWKLYGTIHTVEVNEIKQHAVVIPLQVDYCSESRV